MQRDPSAYFIDILEAAAAIEREFITIGEALKVIAQRSPQMFASIPEGRRIIDFRNLLTHEHQNVRDRVVWGAIQVDLPVLVEHCTQLLTEIRAGTD
ncbi:DUF86 domain-containing protein [Cyanobium sp. FGCU-6]|nr:DUF86 domain-containing protein [Cyanobium sp. FGCU6]